jgi:ATP-dependent Clp protease ATP-binding subunit ClpC
VEGAFRKELVGRLDRIVPFRALGRAEVREVARMGVARLAGRSGLAEVGSTLEVSEAALAHLAEGGYSETYGGRAQRRHLDEHLAAPLARMLSGLGGDARNLVIEVSLASEPEPRGSPLATALSSGLRLAARRRPRQERAEEAHDHRRIAELRRLADGHVHRDGIVELRDRVEVLVTELALTPDDEKDRRTARERAELGTLHHRLSALLERLDAPLEEIYALEELAILALFEGQPVKPLVVDAEQAYDAVERAMPYALLGMVPERDAIALMIEELDEGALHRWLVPLLEELPKRGWTAVVHVFGGERTEEDTWPEKRRWGPPRSEAWMFTKLAERAAMRNLILRVKGPYAGVFLALEAGLHRMVLPAFGEGQKPSDRRAHVGVRTLRLSFDLPDEAWDDDESLVPPPPADAETRRMGPVAREHDRVEGKVSVHGATTVTVASDAYWPAIEQIALAHLVLCDKGSLDRDAFLAPGGA